MTRWQTGINSTSFHELSLHTQQKICKKKFNPCSAMTYMSYKQISNSTKGRQTRKSCSETNTKAALRYRQLAILNLIWISKIFKIYFILPL